MLLDTIRAHITDSVKKNNVVKSETLRFLVAGVRNYGISKYGSGAEASLTDEDVMDVLRKQVKSHKESIDAFRHANRNDLVDKETAQLRILEEYLPAQMSDEDIREVLKPIIAGGEKNTGLLMKAAMEKLKGKAEGGRVSKELQKMIGTN